VREGLAAILSTQEDFVVIGEASNGQEVVNKVAVLQPEVVLLDLEMPGMDGVEALHHLRALKPEPAVIVFTAFDTDERILGALRAGAKGYLLKGSPREEIFHAIRIASQGGSLLEPVIASRLLHHLSNANSSLYAEAGEKSKVHLTVREHEVLLLLAQGMTNREIADRAGSLRTYRKVSCQLNFA
jgi:DNA-binding NarL/FixJ family response regulator